MKQMYLNRINSQVRFENGPKTVRVKSRIGSMNSRILSVLLPMLFVVFGLFGVNESAWGADCTYGFTKNEEKTSINNGETIYRATINGTYYGLSKLTFQIKMTKSVSLLHNESADLSYDIYLYNRSTNSWSKRESKTLEGYGIGDESATITYTTDLSNISAFKVVSTTNFGSYKSWGSTKYTYRSVSVSNVSFVKGSSVSASPTSLTFGEVTYGQSSSAKTVTATYMLSTSGTMTVSCSGDFSATISGSCNCVNSPQTKTVSVTFTPTQTGTRTGTLTISNPDGTSTTVSLSGTGKHANPTLNMNNGSVNVTTDPANPVPLNLANLKASGTTSGIGDFDHFEVRSADAGTGAKIEGVTINGNNFSSIVGGTYTVRAITKQNNQYNSTYKDFTVTVNRLTQTISWTPANLETEPFVEEDIVTATSIGEVSLTKTGTGVDYITIDGNTATVGEVETNSSVTLTATAAQTDVYAQATASKTISLTSLQKQHITFEQNLTKLKTTDGTKKVQLVATSDSGRDSYITFAVDANTAGVTVTKESGKWYLNYSTTAVKGIAVTASLAGVEGVSIAASDVSQMVKVTDPTDKCDINEPLETASGLANTSKTYNLTIPKQVVLKVRSSKSRVYTNNYQISFYNAQGQQVGNTSSYTGNSFNTNTDTRTFSNLSKDIVKMVFKSNASNGFDITDASYTRWSYANTNLLDNRLDFEALALSTVADQTFTLDYANYQIELSIEGSSNFVLKSDDSFGDCEKYGTQTIKVGYNVPAEATEETAFLYIKDNTGTELAKITLHATVQGGLTQNITLHNIGTSYNTTDLVNLTATTDRGLTNFSYTALPAGIASFNGSQMTFSKSGIIAITITEAGNGAYAEATATVENITINKVTPTITTYPTVATIKYLDNFNNNQFSNGLATVTLRGVKNTPVPGTFTWTTLNGQQVTDPAGQHTYSVTFTPTDGGMYKPVTFTLPVTISTATTPTLTMNNTSVDVSRIVPEQGIDHKKLVNLTSLVSALPATNPMDKATFTYAFKSVDTSDDAFAGSAACESSAHIDNTAKTFYATEVGVYTITVTSAATSYYAERSVDFTITVNKLKPTLYFSAEDTVYRVRPVQQAAICVCENETIVTPGVRYASANESAIVEQQIYGKDEYQLWGRQDDDADQTAVTVTASYAGNAYFQAADDAQKAYVAIAKYTPRFFVDNSEETAERTLYVGQELTTSFIYCNAYNDPTYPLTYAIGTSGVISYDPATRTITAENAGTTTLTFTQVQDGYRYFATRDFNFRVLKNTTELTLADQVKNASLYVGDVLSGTLYTANTEEVPVTITSDNEQVIVYENGELRAVGEGDATITFAMTPKNEKALKWEACSLTKTLHVSRRANTLSSNFTSITKSYGGSETFTITASNTDYANYPITLTALTNGDLVAITRTSGNSFLIMAKHTEGTVTLRATQEISTEYVGATLNGLTFTIGKSNYHVPIDLNSTMYNDSYCCIKKEGTTSASDNEITLGDALGGGFNWNDKSVVFRFEGIPDKLTFDFRCYSIVPGGLGDITSARWYIQESADGNFSGDTWTSSRTNQDSYESVTIQLQPSTRYVKLCYGGNYSGQFKNVNISERSELVAAEPATTAGAPYVFEAKPLGSDDSEQSFSMDWYNIDEVNVTSSDPHFSVAPSSFAGYEDYGQQPITVIYHRSMDIGLHTATITITNGTQTQHIYVKGETTKKTATITWHPDIEDCGFLMNPNEVYPSGAIDYVALLSNGGEYTLTSSNPSVISVEGNTLIAHAIGTSTIGVHYAGSGDFYQADKEQLFTVTDATKQTITWNQNLMTLRLGDASLTLDATASSGQPVTYTLESAGIVSVVGNTLSVSAAGDTYITATQAGGTFGGVTYASISKTKRVHVSDPNLQCTDYAISNQSCTFASLQKTAGKVFTLDGPGANRLYFSAYHDKASGTFWDNFEAVGAKTYNPLIIEEYRNNNNTWEWHEIFNQVVNKETAANYSAVVDPTTTKIRISSNEEVTHHVSNISLRRRKEVSASETSINASADCNVLYQKTIRIFHSGVDVLTTSVDGGFRLDKETLGEGCGTYGYEDLTVSITPTELTTYSGTITITDGKNQETRLEIPISVAAQPISQTIVDFTAEATYLTTDDVQFSAHVLSGNTVYYTSSAEAIATVDADGHMHIITSGEVTITAHCDAQGFYNAAPDVSQTFTINKVMPQLSIAPTATEVTVPATLANSYIDASAAVMIDDKGTIITGSFDWEDNTTATTVGTHSYTAIFTPSNTDWYTTADVPVAVKANARAKRIVWSLDDNTTAYCFRTMTMDAKPVDDETGEALDQELTYTVDHPEIAYINEVGTLIVHDAGTITITASSPAVGIYDAAPEQQRTITLQKATPTLVVTPRATPISKEQPLARSYFHSYKVQIPEFDYDVPGSFAWDTPELVIEEPGTYTYPAHFNPTNTRYFNSIDLNVDLRVVTSFWTYVDTENHDYNDPNNWSNSGVPNGLQPDITVMGNVNIEHDINFSSLLVDSGGSVTITNDAKVTISYEAMMSNSGEYGDLIVEDGGELTVNTPLKVHDFILRSAPSNQTGMGKSGQVVNPENLEMINGNVYFELIIPAQENGLVDENQWYGFSVPFPVNVTSGGVARYEQNEQGKMVWNDAIIFNDDYAIANYNSTRRASGLSGWRMAETILYPGKFYLLGIDSQARKYRFRMDDTRAWQSDEQLTVSLFHDPRNVDDLGQHNASDDNWNALGNPNLLYSKENGNTSIASYAYIFKNGTNTYELVPLSSTTFVVGCPFFVQAATAGTMLVNPVENANLAPARLDAEATGDFAVTMAAANTPLRKDRIVVSASEDAVEQYVLGVDVSKFDYCTTEPQLWINAYNKRLAVNQALLENNSASFSLTLSAPQTGTYTIEQETGSNGTLYLMYEGAVIWNLSMGAYDVDLVKGINSGYSLLLNYDAPAVTTNIENIDDSTEGSTTQKLFLNGKLYILRDGQMYDATGKKVK